MDDARPVKWRVWYRTRHELGIALEVPGDFDSATDALHEIRRLRGEGYAAGGYGLDASGRMVDPGGGVPVKPGR